MTLFLNCALRLSELVSLNTDQVGDEILSIIGKGNKERKFFFNCGQKLINQMASSKEGATSRN